MPTLMVALLALAAFGLIRIFLGAVVILEQRELSDKEHHVKVACDRDRRFEVQDELLKSSSRS